MKYSKNDNSNTKMVSETGSIWLENAINHLSSGRRIRSRFYKQTKKSQPSRTTSNNLKWLLVVTVFVLSFVPVINARSTMMGNSDFFKGSENWENLPQGCGIQSDDSESNSNYLDSVSEIVRGTHNEEDESGVRQNVLCKLRKLDSIDRLFKNLTVSQMDEIASIKIECSDVLFYESALVSQQKFEQKQFLRGQTSSLTNLHELQIEYCKIRNVPSLVQYNLINLRKLSLKTHNSDWSAMNLEFSRDSFYGLTNLNVLDLTDNNIWTLPQDVFCPLSVLRELNLSKNRLTDISDLGFSNWGKGPVAPGRTCNTALENLDLSQNSIHDLPDNVFSSLRSLNTLLLQENNMETLADRSFVGLQFLRMLNVSNNRLTDLPPELFQSPRMLQYLHLQNNSLRVLAPGLLEGLDRLEVLDLSHNELNSEWVTRNTFSGLIRLVVLNLGVNQLTKIDHSVFKGLYSLQILNLEHNSIETIADYAFSDLKNLHALTLSHNRLKQLGASYFSDLYVLNQLLLDSNSIQKIDERAFENITHLQDLYLNDNQLEEIPNLSRLKFLKTLDLGMNRINCVRSESFDGLEQLVGLRLTDNLITNISRDAFITLSSLHVLNLASNQIKHVDQSAFTSNPTLRAVRLDNNQLEDISSVFTSLPALVWLNVSDNKIRWFDYSHFPSSLEWLDIHKNNITELGNYFDVGNNLQIKMLDISFNGIKSITDANILNSIETIFLNNNEIEYVAPGTFANKHYLQKVVLYGNQLRKLEIAALALPLVSDARNVPLFYMGNNPFHCDCTMEWLQRINELSYLRQHPQVPDLDQIFCTMEHNRGAELKPLLDINPKEFLCKYESHCFALCHCCDFDACDCEMTCPDRCSCFHDHSWSTNIVDCGNANYTEIPRKIPMDATAIYLDGNNLEKMDSHQFIGKKRLEILHLNNSNISSLHNETFKGLSSLKVIHLENNKLEKVHGSELNHLTNLREIHLDNNMIQAIGDHTFTKMKHLERIFLTGNTITDFDLWQQLGGAFASGSLKQVTFDGSQLQCDCDSLLKWKDCQKFSLSSVSVNIDGFICNNGKSASDMMDKCIKDSSKFVMNNNEDNRVDRSKEQRTLVFDSVKSDNGAKASKMGLNKSGYVPLLSTIVAALIGTALLVTLVYVFRQDVRIWAHAKYGVRLFRDPEARAAKNECNKDKIYDAYMIYNFQDSAFAQQVLDAELQHNGYSSCLHHRDVNMSPFMDSMQSVAAVSRKIVIVLSLNFVHNEWQNQQFRAALQILMENIRPEQRPHKVILILTAPVELIVVDHFMQNLLRTCTVIQWGEKKFWSKLRYMLPDVNTKTQNNNQHLNVNCNGGCIYEKFHKVNQIQSGNTILRYTPAPTFSTGVIVPPTTINSNILLDQQYQQNLPSINNFNATSPTPSNEENDLSRGSPHNFEVPQMYIPSTTSSLGHVYSTISESSYDQHSPRINDHHNVHNNLVTNNGVMVSLNNKNCNSNFV